MKKLIQLLESGERTAFVNSKAVQYTDEKELQDLKDNPDVKSISTAQGKRIKEEAGRKYTAGESQAVGKAVGKSLVKVLRAQGDEVVDIRLTGVGLNKFNIKVKYGNDRGQDLFKFKLNPQSEDIHIETEQGDEPLTDFLITQGNTVSLPTPELESKLAEVMKKYVSEPSPEEYDQMAAMEPESDPSQINKYIPEGVTTFKVGDKVTYLGAPGEITAAEDRYGKQYVSVAYNKGQGRTKVSGVLATNGDVQHAKALEEKQLTKPELKKREEIVKAMKKDGAPKSSKTYAIATAQAKKVAEDLDVGHQDNEPGMLKSDVYRIAKMAAMLYKQLEAYEGTQEVDFPHWWQAKIIKAYDYLQSAYGYLDAEQNTNSMDTTVVTTMALQEKKGTCCHKCGHVHVKGESHPTPYKTGQKSCEFMKVNEATIPGDVAALSKAQQSSTTIQSRSKNINNIGEFPGAFEEWMKTLGLEPGKASRGSIEAQVRKILTNLGYK